MLAGQGPPPKPVGHRRRRNAGPDQTVLPAGGYGGPSPDLPPLAGYDAEGRRLRWLKTTRLWWETWRHAPQAATFGATDWMFLLETAALVERFWRGETNLAGEIRLRCGKLGATPEDRLRLRMTFGQPDVGPGASTRARPGASDDRRRRIMRAVGGETEEPGT